MPQSSSPGWYRVYGVSSWLYIRGRYFNDHIYGSYLMIISETGSLPGRGKYFNYYRCSYLIQWLGSIIFERCFLSHNNVQDLSLSLFSIYNTLFNQIRTSHCRASKTRLFLMPPVLVVAHICPITVLLNLDRGDPDNRDIQILSRKFSDPDGIRTRVTGERTTDLTTKMCFTISIQWLAF